jgi:hypothetical protein
LDRGKKLLETAQLATADLDAMGIAVFGNILLVDLEFSGNGKCLGAGNALLDSFCPEGLFDLFGVHGNSIGFIS